MATPMIEGIHGCKLEAERDCNRVQWPSLKYADAPVAFCGDILGFAPTRVQADIMEAVAAHDRVTVRSGRKIGKSRVAAALAHWHFCTHADATGVFVAPTETQISRVVWHDFVRLFHDSGRCLSCRQRDPSGPRPCPHSACVDGELSASCRTGLRAGGRRVFGISPRNADHMRGISGRHQAYFVDESPGVEGSIYDACDGNTAAGGKIAAFGNPSSRTGWFFDSHTRNPFHRIAVSSLTSPNVTMGRRVVEGLADVPWVESKRAEWGEDDPRWQVEVLGEWPTREMLRLISEVEIAAAFNRWESMRGDEGDLYFGIDPAGGGQGGDASTIVARRGRKVLAMRSFQGGTDRIMSELDALLVTYRNHAQERVTVNFDAASSFGSDLAHALYRRRTMHDDFLRYVPLESRGDARNDILLRSSGCARPRDAYWLNMAAALKRDVGVPYDEELRAELLFAEWQGDREQGSRLIEKKQFRRMLGRSPDLADALAYCLWEGRVAALSDAAAPPKFPAEIDDTPQAPPPDPYALDGMSPAPGGNDGVYDSLYSGDCVYGAR